MQNEPMLCVQDLSVRFKTKYGSAAAVNHVSFSLKKGEKLGLVGESGSGKSVTSKSIIRLLPTPPAQITGSIRLNGEELLTKTERQMCRVRGNQISMIFQEPMVSLDPLFPIGDQLGEVVRLHKKVSQAQANEMSIEMLRTVGIPSPETRLKQYPFELSGGMAQRVTIALALCSQAKLLIADEPTNGLDQDSKQQTLSLLNDLFPDAAKLVITHDISVAASCGRILVLCGGKMLETGSSALVLAAPRHPYTQALLGALVENGMQETPTLRTETGTCPFYRRCPAAFGRCRAEMPRRTQGDREWWCCKE